MHNTNGFLENSGPVEGHYLRIPPKDRTPPLAFQRPEYSELSNLSVTLREKIYGTGAGREYKHYIRRPHRCESCNAAFGSKAAMREHRFQMHSY
jgi:hypothetical protein